MEKEDFENKLVLMTKPEVNQLKHQDMLEKAIANAKDKTALSFWWLIIPLYVISTLLMKSLFMPDTNLISNLHDLTTRQKFVTYIFFLILPIFFILLNIISIRNVFRLSGNPKSIVFLKSVWLNILMILFSILILIVFSL
ncbi:MAG: hypothetical protein WAL29_17525 [Bacteroidales bacterium]